MINIIIIIIVLIITIMTIFITTIINIIVIIIIISIVLTFILLLQQASLSILISFFLFFHSQGKTTQIPQLVFDAAVDMGRGSDINLVVTQPRRISAISVAERIAQERVETVGQTAGYNSILSKLFSFSSLFLEYFCILFYFCCPSIFDISLQECCEQN